MDGAIERRREQGLPGRGDNLSIFAKARHDSIGASAGPVDPTSTKRRQREADTRQQTFPVVDNCEGVKVSGTRQIQASEASDEPKHHDNDQEQTKNTPKPGAFVAVMSVVPSAAKEKNQDKDDKIVLMTASSRQFLIAAAALGSINYF